MARPMAPQRAAMASRMINPTTEMLINDLQEEPGASRL
jgi:hypothetical protein